jgi:ribonuclease P protein component
MLPKANRAGTKEIDKIFKEGSFLNSPSLTFKYFKNSGKEVKISFIAPKSVAKLAVKRNMLRRLGYKALEKHISRFPLGITGAFVFKKYQDDILTIEDEIKNILGKIN